MSSWNTPDLPQKSSPCGEFFKKSLLGKLLLIPASDVGLGKDRGSLAKIVCPSGSKAERVWVRCLGPFELAVELNRIFAVARWHYRYGKLSSDRYPSSAISSDSGK